MAWAIKPWVPSLTPSFTFINEGVWFFLFPKTIKYWNFAYWFAHNVWIPCMILTKFGTLIDYIWMTVASTSIILQLRDVVSVMWPPFLNSQKLTRVSVTSLMYNWREVTDRVQRHYGSNHKEAFQALQKLDSFKRSVQLDMSCRYCIGDDGLNFLLFHVVLQ